MEEMKLKALLNKLGCATEIRILDTKLKVIDEGYVFKILDKRYYDTELLDRNVVFITCYEKRIIDIIVE